MAKTQSVAGEPPIRELRNCTCSRLRRAGRRVTQLYDLALGPAGLTIGQFGLLAYLATTGAKQAGGVAIGVLADARGMDPTTLTRNLKPLLTEGWITEGRNPADRRVRTVAITPAGRKKYLVAAPLWQQAEEQLGTMLGPETLAALNALLEVSIAKIA